MRNLGKILGNNGGDVPIKSMVTRCFTDDDVNDYDYDNATITIIDYPEQRTERIKPMCIASLQDDTKLTFLTAFLCKTMMAVTMVYKNSIIHVSWSGTLKSLQNKKKGQPVSVGFILCHGLKSVRIY